MAKPEVNKDRYDVIDIEMINTKLKELTSWGKRFELYTSEKGSELLLKECIQSM